MSTFQNLELSSDDSRQTAQPGPSSSKASTSGLTLVLPSLSALKQQNGAKYKRKTPGPQAFTDGIGEVKKIPRPLKLKPLKEVLSKLIAQIKKSFFRLFPNDCSC